MKRNAMISSAVALGVAGLVGAGAWAGCSKPAEPDGAVAVALEGLPGLEATVPRGTRVSKNAVGIGVMLKGPDVSMTIGPDLDIDADSLEQARENAQKYAATELQEEVLPDGYILTYESEGSTGPNYWLVGRRRFRDTAYSCGVSSPKKAHQQSAIAICKSLKE